MRRRLIGRASEADILFNPILHLDANDSSSYPGSGTDWFDLTANNNDFTLVNSPTLNNDATGDYFTFNGTNQCAERLATLTTAAVFDSVVILKKPSSINFKGLIEWAYASNRRTGAGFDGSKFLSTSAGGYNKFSESITVNNWIMLEASASGEFRKASQNNTELSGAVSAGATNTALAPISRIADFSLDSRYYLEADIAVVLVYDKILTSTQKTFIYNFYSARFSLP